MVLLGHFQPETGGPEGQQGLAVSLASPSTENTSRAETLTYSAKNPG